MVEILHTCQPPKNKMGKSMKRIFPKQEEMKVKWGDFHKSNISPTFTRENTWHLPKRLSQVFTKEHHTDFK